MVALLLWRSKIRRREKKVEKEKWQERRHWFEQKREVNNGGFGGFHTHSDFPRIRWCFRGRKRTFPISLIDTKISHFLFLFFLFISFFFPFVFEKGKNDERILLIASQRYPSVSFFFSCFCFDEFVLLPFNRNASSPIVRHYVGQGKEICRTIESKGSIGQYDGLVFQLESFLYPSAWVLLYCTRRDKHRRDQKIAEFRVKGLGRFACHYNLLSCSWEVTWFPTRGPVGQIEEGSTSGTVLLPKAFAALWISADDLLNGFWRYSDEAAHHRRKFTT